MAHITMSHADCTIWTITETGIERLAGPQGSIPYETPQPVMAIASSGVSDGVYALQEDQTLLRLVRAAVEPLNGVVPFEIQELSVGRDNTVCALIPEGRPFGTEFLPYVLRDEEWQYFGAPLASAISVVDQNEAWIVSKGRLVRINPSARGNRDYDNFTDAKWVSAASDGTVIVTTPRGVFHSTDPEHRSDWRELAPLPPGSSWTEENGPRVVCGSASLIYASDIAKLWQWNGSRWNVVETRTEPFLRISVAPDTSIVALSPLGVVRSTSFGWEVMPNLFGIPAHTNLNSIWAAQPLLSGGLHISFWAGASWQTLEKTPVVSISAGSDGELWGISAGDVKAGDVKDLYRRNEDGSWTLMKPNMKAVAVGSADWVAALDSNRRVRLRDSATGQWSEPFPLPNSIDFENVGIGDDGTLMASDGVNVYRWSVEKPVGWVMEAKGGVRQLQVIDANIACGFADGIWVSGAPYHCEEHDGTGMPVCA